MKYFLDTEFIEGFKKPIKWMPTIGRFNKPYHSIQLVSIGIIAEDGREYYAVSNEFNPRDADDWVVDNVLLPIYTECVSGDMRNHASFSTRRNSGVTWGRGKSNKQIAEEIKEFCKPIRNYSHTGITVNYSEIENPDFYAYYADYDWVLFCSLFGTMIDLPKGFPMYCRDLKQMLDEKVSKFCWQEIKETSFDSALKRLKNENSNYPQQENEHNALADAKWNKKLFEFLANL